MTTSIVAWLATRWQLLVIVGLLAALGGQAIKTSQVESALAGEKVVSADLRTTFAKAQLDAAEKLSNSLIAAREERDRITKLNQERINESRNQAEQDRVARAAAVGAADGLRGALEAAAARNRANIERATLCAAAAERGTSDAGRSSAGALSERLRGRSEPASNSVESGTAERHR